MCKKDTMDIIKKNVHWGTVIALVFAASWAAISGYFMEGWVHPWPEVLTAEPSKVSLATSAIASNWWALWVFAALTFACAIILAWKRDIPILFAAISACAFLLAAGVFNVLVVSAGFEISGFATESNMTHNHQFKPTP
jgi:hypothetical protein